MFQISARILYNKKTKKSYYEMALAAPQIAKSALPGQFVNIKVINGLEPLLRRPLSIHRIEKLQMADGKWQNVIKILYEVIGKGTEILTQRKAGEYLDTVGPLGKSFDCDGHRNAECGRQILVSGGMGSAPLVFLAETITANSTLTLRRGQACRQAARKPLILIGAKTKEDILCEKEFKDLGCEVKIATDDGSRGFQGHVSDLLESILRTTNDARRTILYACGPTPMLKEISRISKEHNIPAQVSLEAHMACGIGACMGCVVKTKDEKRRTKGAAEYKRVCREGPVFEAGEIVWDNDAKS